jgi:hypothetical protein
MTKTVWQYANNGAISSDGKAQLSGVDRTHYLVRFGAEFVLVGCENYTTNDRPKAAIYLSQPMQWITERGPRDVTGLDRVSIQEFLEVGLPTIGRDVSFE